LTMVLILSRQELETVLTMKDAIDIVEEGFRQLNMGNVIIPQRPVVSVKEHQGLFLVMPAYVSGDMNIFSNKIVTVYPNNPEKYQLPTILASISLHDVKTGALISVMDGAFITAMRTGAVSGVASKYLARKDSKTVGVLGAGVQARTQLEAVCEVLNIQSAKAHDPDREQMQNFCQAMEEKLNIKVEPRSKSESVVRESDVIILATSSKIPVLDGNWLNNGTHINAIGSHTPTTRELDDVSVQRSKIVVDLKEAALSEAGDLLIPIENGLLSRDDVYAELGELVASKKKGRTSDREITIFKSVGLAVQDASVALKAYNLAKDRGLGKTVPI
jgi:alanine dehydrogenase